MQKSEPLFYVPVIENEHDVAGPYDLVQMARLLRTKVISAETLTHRVGEDDWKPFCETPQFSLALEIPANAVSTRLEMLKEVEESKRAPIPLPSKELMIQVGVALVALLLVGVGVYFLSAADTTIGFGLTFAGGTAALLGQAFILINLMDESLSTKLMVFLVPLYDIYYFTTNLEKYRPFFLAKYIGTVLSVAALAGVASVDSTMAEQIQQLLGTARI